MIFPDGYRSTAAKDGEKSIFLVCVCGCVVVWESILAGPACALACAMKRLMRCKLCAKAAVAFCWQNTELDRSQRSKSGWSGRARLLLLPVLPTPAVPASKLPSSAQLNGTCNYMAGCSTAANNTHQLRTPRAELRQKKALVESFGFIGSIESV